LVAVGAAAPFGAAATGGILAQLGGTAGLAKEGPALIEGNGDQWGYNLGATYHTKEFRLGASYRSKMKQEVTGDVTFTGAPTFSTSSALGALGALGAGINARLAAGPVQTTVDLPDTVSVAAAYEKDKMEVLADWTHTGWSSIQSLDITRTDQTLADGSPVPVSSVPLNFESTWRAGLGFNYQMNESWKLRLGTAYDKAPVQDLFRTPRLPDNDRVWAALGAQIKLGAKGALDLGYAHLFISNASSNLPNQDTPTSSPAGKLIGNYDGKVDIFSVQLKYGF
jgi:long-chain fatty acid transport protein